MSPQIEMLVRLGIFGGVLLLMTIWELAAPRRQLVARKGPRWASNLAVVVVNTIGARLLVPITAVATATLCADKQWGLFNQVQWPAWVEFILAVVALDLAIYLQHVMFHAVPLFWRLHMVHHADLDIDVTTGLRFHTLEIVLSAFIKVGAILLLGASPLAVITFEVLLNATAMFNHSNVRISRWCDTLLRWVLVTPDMHRVHHSVIRSETNSNFGFNLPWWDYVFGTYRSQPQKGHEEMDIGLTEYREEKQVDRLLGILLLPFSRRQPPAMLEDTDNDEIKS